LPSFLSHMDQRRYHIVLAEPLDRNLGVLSFCPLPPWDAPVIPVLDARLVSGCDRSTSSALHKLPGLAPPLRESLDPFAIVLITWKNIGAVFGSP
jgi:hypothetical protein